ncbi:MAG: hypothetical protein CTY40_10905, partial [Hyphomicrobium sp.]
RPGKTMPRFWTSATQMTFKAGHLQKRTATSRAEPIATATMNEHRAATQTSALTQTWKATLGVTTPQAADGVEAASGDRATSDRLEA